MVVENQLMVEMITVAAYKAMLEAKLAVWDLKSGLYK